MPGGSRLPHPSRSPTAPPHPGRGEPDENGNKPGQRIPTGLVAPSPDGMAPMDVLEFTRAWLNEQDASQPTASLAWTLEKPASLPLDVLPLKPRRIVRVEQFLHVREDRLELTITASAKTTGLSVFHHALKIDPRLKITSIGIQQQDGADRLARSARVGDQLMLYLKDANLFEEETKRVSRTLPSRGVAIGWTKRATLPEVVFTDAETSSTTLSLYHAPQLAVTLTGAELTSPAKEPPPRPPWPPMPRSDGRSIRSVIRKVRQNSTSAKQLPTPLQLLFQLQSDPDGPWQLRAERCPAWPTSKRPVTGDVGIGPAGCQRNGHLHSMATQPRLGDCRRWSSCGRLRKRHRGDTRDDVTESPDSDRWTPRCRCSRDARYASDCWFCHRISPGSPRGMSHGWTRGRMACPATHWMTTTRHNLAPQRTQLAIGRRRSAGQRVPVEQTSDQHPATPQGARPIEQPMEMTGSPSGWWITWQILVSLALAGAVAWGWPLLELPV
ncbi:MAG: hypothetical protein CM1200mP2_09510 [Planctomycetaceae bacterium]|nr:MAG: hypothetical protein CM1200mP2_09510 [Planctomycetaceae bacterium]